MLPKLKTGLIVLLLLTAFVLVNIKSDTWKRLPMALLDLTANYSRNPLPIPSPDLKGNSSTSWKKQPASQTVTGSINIETLREGFITESDSLLDKPITDVKETVSIGRSSIKLLDKKAVYNVGDEVRLAITLRDGYGQTRTRGGDQLRVRVFNTSLQAYAAGYVEDHNNGTYTACVRTYWPGQQTISVILAYRREAVRELYYKRAQPLSWRNIGALFKTKQKKEKTLCFPDPKGLTDYSELCNLTEANGGMAWFCGKPDTLLCKDLYSIELYQNKTEPVGRDIESILLSRKLMDPFPKINIQVKGALATRTSLLQCGTYPAVLSWNRTQPAGFFYKKIWHSDICRSPRFVNYNKCLRNTSLLLIGDSTLRQWYSFLEPNLSCRRRTEQWTNAKWHRMAACSKPFLKFEMKWIPHSQPCFMNERWMGNSTNLASISKVMDTASNNTRLVIVFQNYAHLLSFHYSVYQMRMRTISNSVRKLLRRNKNAKIFIKGPHTFYHFYDKFDYYAYLFKHIIYKEFKGLHDKVFFLDQTDMTIATDTRAMHPTEEVVQASVSQMLNHICPVT